jgi:sulfotransferase family protein
VRLIPDHPPAPFIIGLGRSGTTLLRLMLDAHSCLAIPPETGFLSDAAGLLDDEATARERFLALVTAYKTWPDLGIETDQLWTALETIEPFTVADGVRALYRAYAQRHGKPRFGDKTPGYTAKLHKVQAVLPEARFIHIIRDGRDVALSMRAVWFGRDRSIDEHIDGWRRKIQRARARSALCRWYLEVRYEDLVRGPQAELRRICDFIELPYEHSMLRYFEHAESRLNEVTSWLHADGTVRVSKSERLYQHRFTSCPPLPTRICRYRHEMTDHERQRCVTIAGDLLAELGYDT